MVVSGPRPPPQRLSSPATPLCSCNWGFSDHIIWNLAVCDSWKPLCFEMIGQEWERLQRAIE